jgi:uncharacterized protein (UPF0305 family)
MYLDELIESLKNESSGFEEDCLMEKLDAIKSNCLKDLKILKMQMLLKYNIETMLELKHKIISVENILIDDIKVSNLKLAIDAYIDKYAPGQEKQKNFVRIISVYLTFIANKPLHPEGLFDPDGKAIYKNGRIVCPIKSKEVHEVGSLCRFCVASM